MSWNDTGFIIDMFGVFLELVLFLGLINGIERLNCRVKTLEKALNEATNEAG